MSIRTIEDAQIFVGFHIFAFVAIWLIFPQIQESNPVSTEVASIVLIDSLIKSTYPPTRGYAKLTTSSLINARRFFDSMINGAAVNNTFGGAVTVAVGTLGGIANNAYTITAMCNLGLDNI